MMGVSSQQVVVTVNGQKYLVEVLDLNATPIIAVVDGQPYEVSLGGELIVRPKGSAEAAGTQQEANILQESSPNQTPPAPPDTGSKFRVTAPMPGDIIEVCVKAGQKVRIGDALCVLDAMKMKNIIHSPRDGLISSVDVRSGQSVDYGDPLVTYG
jgi:biotin carboxyl carrier protein